MANHTIKVGNVEMVSLKDALATRSPVDTFPGSTIEEWREFPELLTADEEISSRVGTTAIRSGGKLLIVDTGLQLPGALLLDEMKEKGVDRDAVDLVVLTHLHPDHVGWNMSDGRPTFPNARYLVSQTDWDYWSQPSVAENAPHIKSQVFPLLEHNVMDLMDDGYNITDEVSVMLTPGHTPGHMSIVIASAGEMAFVLGDVANNPVQAHHTDWCPIFDMDKEMAIATRHGVLDKLEADGTLVSAGHFPEPGFGHFVRVEGRRLWQGV